MNKVFIGIDPDCIACGVSMLIKYDGIKDKLIISKMPFFELFDCLKFESKRSYQLVKVYLEAGWLNKRSNWHSDGLGEFVSGRIGAKVGANHEVGKLIAKMCEYLQIDYELVQPRTSKFGIKQFRMMTKYEGKLDQDMVDSALLIWGRV